MLPGRLAFGATSGSAVGQAAVVDKISDPNIVQVAVGSADHTTLVAAVQAAGLVDVLANNGPLTVFAPTNAAFAVGTSIDCVHFDK